MANVFNLRSKDDRSSSLNIYGQPLNECSCDPMTGWFRDGYCKTDDNDHGHHVVCCVMSDEFLQYSKSMGNDLMTSGSGFPGLKAGDHWCLCASRWLEAYKEGKAPLVDLNATHLSALSIIKIEDLEKMAFKS